MVVVADAVSLVGSASWCPGAGCTVADTVTAPGGAAASTSAPTVTLASPSTASSGTVQTTTASSTGSGTQDGSDAAESNARPAGSSTPTVDGGDGDGPAFRTVTAYAAAAPTSTGSAGPARVTDRSELPTTVAVPSGGVTSASKAMPERSPE